MGMQEVMIDGKLHIIIDGLVTDATMDQRYEHVAEKLRCIGDELEKNIDIWRDSVMRKRRRCRNHRDHGDHKSTPDDDVGYKEPWAESQDGDLFPDSVRHGSSLSWLISFADGLRSSKLYHEEANLCHECRHSARTPRSCPSCPERGQQSGPRLNTCMCVAEDDISTKFLVSGFLTNTRIIHASNGLSRPYFWRLARAFPNCCYTVTASITNGITTSLRFLGELFCAVISKRNRPCNNSANDPCSQSPDGTPSGHSRGTDSLSDVSIAIVESTSLEDDVRSSQASHLGPWISSAPHHGLPPITGHKR